MFPTVRQARLWDVYCLQLPIRSYGKNYISGYIWHKSFIETVKCAFFNKIIVYQSFLGAPFTFSYFLLQGKVLCSASLLREVYCLKRRSDLLETKYISGYIWHKSFIQTIKCFFFNQIIVNQSFYGALLTFSYILLKGKVLCFAPFGKSLVRCLLSEAADQTLWKKLYLRSYLTQIVH